MTFPSTSQSQMHFSQTHFSPNPDIWALLIKLIFSGKVLSGKCYREKLTLPFSVKTHS